MGKPFKQNRAVRDLRFTDLLGVRRILESRIRDSASGEVLAGEVSDVIEGMSRALQGRRPARFLVAVGGRNRIAGVLGMRPLSAAMEPFARGEHPIEMVHAFVAVDLAGSGVGSALVAALEDRARFDGHDEILLNSGPRYATSGWGFFDRQPGYERLGVVRNLYGPGQDAAVWSKLL